MSAAPFLHPNRSAGQGRAGSQLERFNGPGSAAALRAWSARPWPGPAACSSRWLLGLAAYVAGRVGPDATLAARQAAWPTGRVFEHRLPSRPLLMAGLARRGVIAVVRLGRVGRDSSSPLRAGGRPAAMRGPACAVPPWYHPALDIRDWRLVPGAVLESATQPRPHTGAARRQGDGWGGWGGSHPPGH